LRDRRPRERLSELRRRLHAAAGASVAQLEGRQLHRQVSAIPNAEEAAGRSGSPSAVCGADQVDSTGAAM